NDLRGMPPAVPIVVLTVGVMCISFSSIFARYADAPALVKSAYRVGFSALIVVPYAFFFHRREYGAMSRRDFGLCAASGFFLAVHFATWIASLDYTTIASSVILVNTIPIWIALFGIATCSVLMSSRMWVSVMLSFLGAGIVGYGDISFSGEALKGDMLAVAGAMSGAGYILCGRTARKKMGLVPYIALCYGSAAVFLWGAVLVCGYRVTGFSNVTWGAFIGSAVMSQILGHSSYNWALGYFSAGFVGIMLLGEPLGSTILAFFLFGEAPSPVKLAGCALLLCAIAIAAKEEST
ncbi:MAG: DMT family transporter, partial [Synergistaceae bacterium]|nr:DMT family transporter [Synergistaceae bacterium]